MCSWGDPPFRLYVPSGRFAGPTWKPERTGGMVLNLVVCFVVNSVDVFQKIKSRGWRANRRE
jgi:hypothetical protein